MTEQKNALEASLDRIKKYNDGTVHDQLVHDALEYFISIEPDPAQTIDYKKYLARFENDESFIKSLLILKRFAEQIPQRTFAKMQEEYYRIIQLPRFSNDSFRQGVAITWLHNAWDGIDEWKR